MSLSEMTGKESPAGDLLRGAGKDFLHGQLRCVDEGGGWVRPWRFSADQMRALGSCQAWHPGLFRQMARTTAGICLELTTDSSEIVVELRVDEEPSATRAVLDYVDGAQAEARMPHDGVSLDVDGRHVAAAMPGQDEELMAFALDDPDGAPAGGIMQLPGFGGKHHVRVWLPCLRGCVIRDVLGNGTFLEPVDPRPQLLVLGDSIAQGFVSDDPALSWCALLSQRLGLDLVNQGLGGQVFQPGSFYGFAEGVSPQKIVVEFGANYRYEHCLDRRVTRDIRSYLLEVSRLWPAVPTWVLTPLWHDEQGYPSHSMSCWERVPIFLAAHCAPHDQMRLVDGRRLLDPKTSLMADGFEHPNPQGQRQLALRLAASIEATDETGQDVLRTRAKEALRDAPRRAFPLVEAVRRGLGRVVFARVGCVLLELPDGQELFWASDYELGRSVIAAVMKGQVVDALEPGLVRDIELTHGLGEVSPYHLAIYEGSDPLEPDASKDIRVLDESRFSQVRARYSHPEYQTDDQVRALLAAGKVLGGFEGGELVGFIGEHPEGSMGMLEVFEGHRRAGWAQALEAAKINEQLSLGLVPWGEIYPDNRASLRLQRKLGLRVTPSNEQCFLSARVEAELRKEFAQMDEGEAPASEGKAAIFERHAAPEASDSLARLAQELGLRLVDEVCAPPTPLEGDDA